MTGEAVDSLWCGTCRENTAHVWLTYPRLKCCTCHTVRTAGGSILYGIEATP